MINYKNSRMFPIGNAAANNDLERLIEQSKAVWADMTPEQQAEHRQAQRASFARGMAPCEHGKADWEQCGDCWAEHRARKKSMNVEDRASQLEFITRVLKAVPDDEHKLMWRDGNDQIKFSVICNDWFYGGADAEEITPENIDLLERSMSDATAAGHWEYGLELFCARARGMRPQEAFYQGLNDQMIALLNDCGPEKADG